MSVPMKPLDLLGKLAAGMTYLLLAMLISPLVMIRWLGRGESDE